MLWIIFKVFFSGNVRGRVEADMFCLFCFEESSKEKFSSNLSSSEHFSSRSFPGVTVLEKFLDLNVFYRSGRTFLSFWAEKHPGWTSKRLFWRCSLLQDNRWECFRWFLPLMFAKKKTRNTTSLNRGSNVQYGALRSQTGHVTSRDRLLFTLFCLRELPACEEQVWGSGAEKLPPGRFSGFSLDFSAPSEADLVKKSLNWVTAVLHTVAPRHISLRERTIWRPGGRKRACLLNCPPSK